jgi:hydrogenase maturation protein HypF
MSTDDATGGLRLSPQGPIVRVRATVRGAVQGVGFRPFVYRLAAELGLKGWVGNSGQGAVLEVEGGERNVRRFFGRLRAERPPACMIRHLRSSVLPPAGHTAFHVCDSNAAGPKSAVILPDLATCLDCLREVFDPADRRYRYPFANCTSCGPRFSILEALPYDRARTSMKGFRLCERCRAEYEEPDDRRFHAQPNACPACGPHLELWDASGRVLAARDDALHGAAAALRRAAVAAVKGLGGFHLMVDARDRDAVHRLRQRKAREEKPLALMYPDRAFVRRDCEVSPDEERLLLAPEAPIVLLRRKAGANIAAAVAPGNPYLGVMLPYTPLHHLLLAELGFPVVATSGNCSDEPICTDEHEALARLAGIADVFLVHDRPIVRHVDDSVVRVVMGREMVLRRARGYAPLPVEVAESLPPLLAAGGHLKNTVAVSVGRQVFLSQHIGDLETAPALEAFRGAASDLPRIYNVRPEAVACDLHPDYHSSRFAERAGVPVVRVQHHYAHILACMAEHGLAGPVLGVAWDGTGYGTDGTVWGGEFLRVTGTGFKRVTHFRRFPLPGGDRAVREPRRSALGLLYEMFGEETFCKSELAPLRAFSARELAALRVMLAKGLNAPRTSSAGRLFDAVGSVLGLRQAAAFEGQAAMELEFARDGVETGESYPFRIAGGAVDWGPMLLEILREAARGDPAARVAAKFHNALADMVVAVARQVGQETVVLSGGCFQNATLLEATVSRLRAAGFLAHWPQRIPPNDGGIALGQVLAAARRPKE